MHTQVEVPTRCPAAPSRHSLQTQQHPLGREGAAPSREWELLRLLLASDSCRQGMDHWAVPRERQPGASEDWTLPGFRRHNDRGARASHAGRPAGNGLQFVRTQAAALGRARESDTFSHVGFTRKAMPSRPPQADGGQHRRRKREPHAPSFAQPTGRLRSGRGLGRAALTAQARAQADLEDVIKGTVGKSLGARFLQTIRFRARTLTLFCVPYM
jgi:hypothetical protein